jgi:hypothetical protein
MNKVVAPIDFEVAVWLLAKWPEQAFIASKRKHYLPEVTMRLTFRCLIRRQRTSDALTLIMGLA